MPIVKTVSVRISTDGAADAKLKIDAVAAKADELGKLHPEIKVRIDAAAATVQLAILRQELRRTAATTGFQGAAGGAGGAASGGSGVLGTLLFGGGGSGVLIGALAAVAALLTGAGGIIPLITAAGIGIGAFGAFAIPTFMKITAGVTALGGAVGKVAKNQAWAAIPKAIRPAVRGITDLQAAFGKMALALQPLVLKITGTLTQILGKLLPALMPIARTAGKAIEGLLKQFSNFASSPGFKSFMATMNRLAGPAIKTIGEGIGRIGVSLGHLLTALINPNGIRALRLVFQIIGNGIQWLANAIRWATPKLIALYRGVSDAWKILHPELANIPTAVKRIISAFSAMIHAGGNVVHAIGNVVHAGGNVIHVFGNVVHAGGNVVHALGNVGHAVGNVISFFAAAQRDIGNWIANVVAWFGALPGKIVAALGNLGSLLTGIGRSIMGGLLSGIESAWQAVAGFLSSLAGKIASLKGPLPRDRMLLYPHGQAIIGGLLAGMTSQMPALTAVTAGVTAAVTPGTPASGGGGSNLDDIAGLLVELIGATHAAPSRTAAGVAGAIGGAAHGAMYSAMYGAR